MSCGIPCPCLRLQPSPTDDAVTPGPSAMLRAIAGALASPNRSPILSDSSSLGIPLARSQRLLSWCAVNHDLAWNRRSCAANLDYSYSPSASSGGLLHRRPVVPMHRDSGARAPTDRGSGDAAKPRPTSGRQDRARIILGRAPPCSGMRLRRTAARLHRAPESLAGQARVARSRHRVYDRNSS